MADKTWQPSSALMDDLLARGHEFSFDQVVDFLEGDPDRPIVTGCLYNADNLPINDLEKSITQSGFRTRSTPGGGPDNFNELRFDDGKGAEEIFLQSERDWNILVKNNKGENVGGDSSASIGGSSTVTVKGSSSERAEEITLTANTRITLTCGGSSIVLDPSGIKINGILVKVNS